MKYYISEKALESIERESRRSTNTETGGILVGYRACRDAPDESKVIITHASGPGPEFSASATHFVKDTPYLQSVLELLFQYHQVNYLGVWHKHLGDMAWPSSGDVSSAMQEINGGTVGLRELVTPIATMHSGHVEIHPHIIRDGSAAPVSWKSVPHDKLPDGRSVSNQWHETEAGLVRLKEEMDEFESRDIQVEVRRGDDGTYRFHASLDDESSRKLVLLCHGDYPITPPDAALYDCASNTYEPVDPEVLNGWDLSWRMADIYGARIAG